MLFVEAGTVHAIGGGMTLLEVQQTSDTTFRLYDYGRPRDLHLTDGLSVIKLQNASGKIHPSPIPHGLRLIAAPHFIVDRYDIPENRTGTLTLTPPPTASCLITLEGAATLGDLPLLPGEATILPAGLPPVTITGTGTVIHCTVPASASAFA